MSSIKTKIIEADKNDWVKNTRYILKGREGIEDSLSNLRKISIGYNLIHEYMQDSNAFFSIFIYKGDNPNRYLEKEQGMEFASGLAITISSYQGFFMLKYLRFYGGEEGYNPKVSYKIEMPDSLYQKIIAYLEEKGLSYVKPSLLSEEYNFKGDSSGNPEGKTVEERLFGYE